MAPFLPWPLHLSLLTISALIAAAYVQPDSAVVAEASALDGAPLASYNYAPAAQAPEAQQSQAAYSGWADQYRHRQRRNALRSRRRRMDNPRYYQPNAEYGSDAQVAWENYRLRAHEKRDSPAEIQRHDGYQGYAASMEADSSAARYKSNDNRRDVQAEQAYAGQGYDDRSAYKRYQKQRRAAVPEPAAVPSQKRRSNWAAWPSDYGEPQEPQEAQQQPWNGRYPQYEYGDDRGQREEATAAAQQPNYANDVAGQDGGVEQAGDNELAYQKK
ncbi:hypothetical protein HPB47_025764 [Ixodes persulcatus]|uniref:Uncharacterized protein n=1 Tax=Ixodes persulcatus TaxID=34615 RepID=A0AC60Q0T0_IXOPE|nr:hypothetical protein HPB47_025764 [Ixodes persulcatus]